MTAVDVLGSVLVDEGRSMSMRVRAAQTLLRASKIQEKTGQKTRNRALLLERLAQWQHQAQESPPQQPADELPAPASPPGRSYSAQHAATKKGRNGWAFGGG